MVNYTRKKGGKYIAQGTYGCVFGDPPLKCDDEDKRSSEDEVSKLMDYSPAITEIEEGEKWHAIDPTQQFSLTPSRRCGIEERNIEATNEYNKCTVEYKTEINTRLLVFYKNGGLDLHNLIPLSANYEKIFSGFQNLFDGLAIAHKKNLVHTDIKPANILTGHKEIHLRFIDFGLSFDVSYRNIIDQAYINPNFFYPYWPLEFKCIDRTGDLRNFEYAKSSYDKFNRSESFESTMWGLTKYRIPFDTLYNIYKETNFKDIKTLFKKMDVFSMGISLMEIMRVYFSHHPIQQEDGSYKLFYTDRIELRSNPYSSFTDLKEKRWLTEKQYNYQMYLYENVTTPLMNFISHCVDYNPNTRYNAEEAANEYRKLVPIFKTHLKQDEIRRRLDGLYILSVGIDVPPLPTPVKSSAKRNSPLQSNNKNNVNSIPPFVLKSAYELNKIYKKAFKKPLDNKKIQRIARVLGSTLDKKTTTSDEFLSDIIRLVKEKYNLVLLI